MNPFVRIAFISITACEIPIAVTRIYEFRATHPFLFFFRQPLSLEILGSISLVLLRSRLTELGIGYSNAQVEAFPKSRD